jgi:hypothetical protein
MIDEDFNLISLTSIQPSNEVANHPIVHGVHLRSLVVNPKIRQEAPFDSGSGTTSGPLSLFPFIELFGLLSPFSVHGV